MEKWNRKIAGKTWQRIPQDWQLWKRFRNVLIFKMFRAIFWLYKIISINSQTANNNFGKLHNNLIEFNWMSKLKVIFYLPIIYYFSWTFNNIYLKYPGVSGSLKIFSDSILDANFKSFQQFPSIPHLQPRKELSYQ